MTSSSDTSDVGGTDAAVLHSERLAALIREEIAARGGRIPFDRFMELALYAPGLGYYVSGARKLGAGGDFVTAPEISPLFGRCIAVQCREVLDRLDGGDILELGAGSGAMAAEILGELDEQGALPRRYLILEVSPELRDRQHERLRQQHAGLIDRVDWLERLPEGFEGVVLANEVLDAMPVHRFRIGEDRRIQEVFVASDGGRWVEVDAPAASPGLLGAVRGLQAGGLAGDPGYASEINLRLGPWLVALYGAIERALALLIDYGYTRAEYYHPERRDGTLVCHFRHRAHSDPYVNLGLQDVTAHVDFTAVAEGGAKAGFGLAGHATQAHFLLGCGLDELIAEAMTGSDTLEVLAGARQLVLPQGMGERFRVLGLEKGVSGPWRGFSVRDLRERLTSGG
jgi:SAM-dependent MidA family methyltransferase